MGAQNERWMVGEITKDEGWKITSEDAYIGNEDDGKQKEWIATVYDKDNAKYIVDLHNLSLAIIEAKDKKTKRKRRIRKRRKRS